MSRVPLLGAALAAEGFIFWLALRPGVSHSDLSAQLAAPVELSAGQPDEAQVQRVEPKPRPRTPAATPTEAAAANPSAPSARLEIVDARGRLLDPQSSVLHFGRRVTEPTIQVSRGGRVEITSERVQQVRVEDGRFSMVRKLHHGSRSALRFENSILVVPPPKASPRTSCTLRRERTCSSASSGLQLRPSTCSRAHLLHPCHRGSRVRIWGNRRGR